jgi:hypothetical protein
MLSRSAKKRIRVEVGRRRVQRAEADGGQGVGGLRSTDDAGERGGMRTRSSEGGPCRYEL